MYFNKLVPALAVAIGATQAAAFYHGEVDEISGQVIRWQQLAEGVFTGVPVEKWDDNVNKISEEVWDVEEIISRDIPAFNTRDLETRNLESFCQAITTCVVDSGSAALRGAINTWITLADYARGNEALMTFLGSGFVANAAGVAIAGVISGQINEATKKECSTSSSEADVIGAVLNNALAHNPNGEDVTVRVNGPSGTWEITVNAAPEGQKPPATCHS